MKNKLTTMLAVALLLAGCATEYQPQNSEGGYSEAALAPGVWRVKVAASAYTLQQQVQDFSLLRSAELTLQQGYSHFALMTPDGVASTEPGRDVVVHMFQQPSAGNAVRYDARAVCNRLGTRYEVTCRTQSL